MIEIHSHIIPALDDGPADMAMSVAMGRIALDEGTRTIISTSHSSEASAVGLEGMQARLADVQAAWDGVGLDIKLELGMEIYLDFDTVEGLKSGRLWTLAGSQYVLVELPYSPWPSYADRALFDLQLAGYTPILAHPERYSAVQADPNVLYALAERGILAQVTASALFAEGGADLKKTADVLVRHGLVQFISSDSHNPTRRRRMPLLREAVAAAALLVGEEAAWKMVTTHPAAVLAHQPLLPDPRPVEPRKSLFGGLFGKRE